MFGPEFKGVVVMRNIHRRIRSGNRALAICSLVLLIAASANAYTIVMRGGRHIEIPSTFIVTPATLTYEVAQGIQITLQMSAIDVPATEKANNEPPGSLLRRAQLSLGGSAAKGNPEKNRKASQGRRTITNRDLEAAMRRRRESELAYERRRKQLGLPSVEESRKRDALERQSIEIELQQKRDVERETENYWRARASALRTEIAAVDAELMYIRTRLDEVPFPNAGGSFSSFTSIVPFPFGNFRSFGNFGGRRSFLTPNTHRPSVFAAPGGGPQVTPHVGFGGATRGQVFLNAGAFPYARPIGIGAPFPIFPNINVFGSTLQPYDFSYERSALITRFNELAGARAGLNARWSELEDEARRAGAPPGWLRQ
jgi:hypothetical protein